MSLAWLINSGPTHGITLSGYEFHDVLLVVGYRLIHASPLAGFRPGAYRENALHLGLVAFMTTFFLGLGLKRPEVPLLRELFRIAIQEHQYEERGDAEILLWVLFVSKSSVMNQPGDDLWIIPKVKAITNRLGIHNWNAISSILHKYPWVGCFQDAAAQTLWSESQTCRLLTNQLRV
ncbi:hypothetical protein F5Y15DRAFT_173920 [Xylariaceae sp. FL0016]|nr:hypothetical protein F5Y15DRAFT_173920 [Xylariaceae sp. FL0016]